MSGDTGAARHDDGSFWVYCDDCAEYAHVRMAVVHPHIVARAAELGEHRTVTLARFMRGVHRRHLDGLPILPKAAA